MPLLSLLNRRMWAGSYRASASGEACGSTMTQIMKLREAELSHQSRAERDGVVASNRRGLVDG
jgi:hypothetical protein